MKSCFFPRVVQKLQNFQTLVPPEVTPLSMILKLINNQECRCKENQYHGGSLEIGGRNYVNLAIFSLIFSQNTGSFKKYIQTLVRRTSSDFKTPQSSFKNTRLRLAFSTPLGVWKSEEVLLLVFELLLRRHFCRQNAEPAV